MTNFICPRRHIAECGSTNDLAREWALDRDSPAPCGALVTADFQTNGRGRRGRQWEGVCGDSALMSFVYRPSSPPAEFGQLGLVAALAVSAAIARVAGVEPQIKWPNDVLLGGAKVAGILVESCFTPTPTKLGVLGPVVIVGIGVNVSQERFAGEEGFAYAPTSLRLASGQPQDVSCVIEAVAHSLLHWEECWRQDGFLPILEQCRKRLAVGAAMHRREIAAVLAGLDDDGGALVRLPDGTFAHWTTVD